MGFVLLPLNINGSASVDISSIIKVIDGLVLGRGPALRIKDKICSREQLVIEFIPNVDDVISIECVSAEITVIIDWILEGCKF